MAGGGYNIPVSIAPASSNTQGANQNTGVTYNFSSAGARGANYSNQFNPDVSTTATASAALAGDNGQAQSQASAQVATGSGGQGQDWQMIAIIGGSIIMAGLVVGLAIYAAKH